MPSSCLESNVLFSMDSYLNNSCICSKNTAPIGCLLEASDAESNPWLMAVDKPSGLLTQPGLGPEQSDSVITRLQQQEQGLRLVHRLDRDTSGVLLLARSAEALRHMV